MAIKYRMFCAKCWQEFDTVAEHNSGSMVATQGMWEHLVRLDGSCAGDIHLTADYPRPTRPKPAPEPELAFGEGGIQID